MDNTNTPKRPARFRRPTQASSTGLPALATQGKAVQQKVNKATHTQQGLPSLRANKVETVDDGYVSALAIRTPTASPKLPTQSTPKLPVATQTKPAIQAKAMSTSPAVSPRTATNVDTPKPVDVPTKKRRVRVSAADKPMLEALYVYGRLTLGQLARVLEQPTDNIRFRVRQLISESFIGVDDDSTMNRYYAKRLGLDFIGKTDTKVQARPADSTFAHTNKLNSQLIGMSIGDDAFNELAQREIDAQNRDITTSNVRWAGDNELLLMKQEQLRQKENLTAVERNLLRRKPKDMAQLVDAHQPVSFMPWSPGAKPVLSERLIRLHEQEKGVVSCQMDWAKDMEAFLHLEGYPLRWESNPNEPLTDDERRAIEHAMKTFADAELGYMFKHQNQRNASVDGSWETHDNFDHKHSYDGVALLPHIVSADGKSIRGGSWGIELEDSKKTAADYARVIQQTIDHPLLAGVLYITDKKQIHTRVVQGMTLAITQLASNNRDPRLSHEAKKAEATRTVNAVLRINKVRLINGRHNSSGYWG